jgi:uncharacterized protein
MAQPAKAQEPSMEEILASIRRIIADDDPSQATTAAAAPEAAPAAPPPAPVTVAAPPPPPSPAPAAAAAPPPPKTEPVLAPIETVFIERAPLVRAAEPDVLELTEAMAAPAVAEGFRTIDGSSDLDFEDMSVDEPPPREVPAPPEVRSPMQQQIERGLISSATSAAVDSAFNSLAHTVLVQNARTLEDLVREMLRPMLKSWLDDNLPNLVERLVRTEIERVSRGRG